MEESRKDENIRYQNLSELSQYIFSITKMIESLSNKPIQMKKEFDIFCKKEAKNFDRLLKYFNSTENPLFPSNFWDGNKSNIKKTSKGSLEEIIEKIQNENDAIKTPTTESLVLSALSNVLKSEELERSKNSENDRKVRIDKSEKEQRMSSYFPKEEIVTDSEKIAILKSIKEESGIFNEFIDESMEDKIVPTGESIKEFFQYRNKFETGYLIESRTGLNLSDLLNIKTKTKQERLSWIFNVIINAKKKNKLASNDPVYVEFSDIIIKPFFILTAFEEDFNELFGEIKKDKDFFRKHNMTNYNPDFEIDPLNKEDGIIKFSDFTDDFIKAYTEDRLRIKYFANNSSSKAIQKIEILEDKEERGRIKVYINGNYNSLPLDFARKGNWQLMYKVASKEYVDYDKKGKAFYDYFNYNDNNPLYAKYGFEKTTLLKREDSEITPNIEIRLTTQSKITRQLKSA